jgi:uncharacterized membrane protein
MNSSTIQVSKSSFKLGWLPLLIMALFIFNGLPFLAPVLMKLGWEGAGRLIYLAYWPLCHQMAQRSFFLFGPEGFQMYSIAQLPINTAGRNLDLALKQFLGSEALGWKVAWSDRMVSMFGGPLVAAMVYAIARSRGRVKAWPLWAIGLMFLPMILDGGTHMISDMLGGVGHGFRDSNQWLALITGNGVPAPFYQGDALGSFNSWMRLASGLMFGFAVGWFIYPYIDMSAIDTADATYGIADEVKEHPALGQLGREPH